MVSSYSRHNLTPSTYYYYPSPAPRRHRYRTKHQLIAVHQPTGGELTSGKTRRRGAHSVLDKNQVSEHEILRSHIFLIIIVGHSGESSD